MLDAEGGAHPRDPMRVWVFTLEVPEGAWGGGGRVVGLADIAGLALGDRDAGRSMRSGCSPSGAVSRSLPADA